MKKTLVSMALLLVVSAGPAFGGALLPGTGIDNPDLGVNATPDFSLTDPAWFTPANQVDQMVSNYVGAFAGTVTSTVFRNPGDGFLAFEYQFTNTTVLPGGAPPGGPVLDLVRATIGDPATQPWAGWAISDAGSDSSARGVLPVGASTAAAAPNWTDGDPYFILRDPVVSGEGLTVQWRVLTDGALVGTTIQNNTDVSARVWFVTNATNYAVTNVGLLDTGSVSDAQGFAPSIIPEPATLGLLGIGGLGFLLRRRRRKK